MQRHRWAEIAKEQINPLATRQMIHGATMTVALEMRQGATVPEHSHHNEQITTIESGRVKFRINGQELILESGESLHIPAHVPHSAEALQDCVAVDVFSPPREDWIRAAKP